ncbi:hypothetical protein TVAG_113110 [Trichomonas vaginalis G3]|uniref:Uncharacterized protein n=1 Tax=Trichomonas vaginalis (strain ATCC PRA-98 / G3) TaxID=412133 RepID=A2F758_TRIV3|nr:hypothetical protein TVAGG3_0258850 [Trichomonas vaginalis G3]EAX99295.1 hypothetical protein TVAG_113110 [Trichomonas vaginalis G3]KAI5524961.1 hypothetical protein TVAGG3_0258850 [Trichomonas vaginalis G3]|eukprot:XP_001312225.1 hypothetical protein [Trichomonas vaginalis G3]
MSTAAPKVTESTDVVKTFLKNYSRFLRRDFLAILVKMTAKELGIRTVRCDWRTRKGMLAFLSASWERFVDLTSRDTIFKWYCNNFDSLEKVFSNRKLMMFIYANWSEYGTFFSSPATLSLIKNSQNEIDSYITTGANARNQGWTETEAGQVLSGIISHFKGGLPQAAPAKPAAKPIVEEPKILEPETANFDASLEASSSPDDEIVIENSYDCLPFEIGAFGTNEFPTVFHVDDPYLFDDYSL